MIVTNKVMSLFFHVFCRAAAKRLLVSRQLPAEKTAITDIPFLDRHLKGPMKLNFVLYNTLSTITLV